MRHRSPETQELVNYLRECYEGNLLATYQQMNSIARRDVRKKRWILTKALLICLRELGLNFEVVSNQGYLPLEKEKVGKRATETAQGNIRGTTKRWRERLNSVDVGTLDGDAFNQHVSGYLKLEIQERVLCPEANTRLDSQVASKHITGRAGLEYAKETARALMDIS